MVKVMCEVRGCNCAVTCNGVRPQYFLTESDIDLDIR